MPSMARGSLRNTAPSVKRSIAIGDAQAPNGATVRAVAASVTTPPSRTR